MKSITPRTNLISLIKKILQSVVIALFFFSSFHTHAQPGSYERFLAAIKRDQAQTLATLLERGFDINSPSPEMEPPLILALRHDALEAARFLVAQPGLNLDARNSADENALMIAALRGHEEIVQALVERGAQVNKPGWTPLHYAATHDGSAALAMVALLLEHHAFIDAESPNKTTPLMMASQFGLLSVVKLLLQEGAEPMARNDLGLNAIHFAQQVERHDVVEAIAAFVRQQSRLPAGSW